MDLVAALTAVGFAEDAQAKTAAQQNADAQNLSRNGPYVVLHVLTKDDVVVTVEQNTSPDDVGGLRATLTHPPCAVIASPKGRVAFNPEDTELALSLVAELS